MVIGRVLLAPSPFPSAPGPEPKPSEQPKEDAFDRGHPAVPRSTPGPARIDPAVAARLLAAFLAGDHPITRPAELLAIQALALDTVLRLFRTPGDDDALLGAVREKLGWFSKHLPNTAGARALFGEGPAAQCDALNLILRTFHGEDAGDQRLRMAAYDKLGKLGRPADVPALLLHVRKATTPADLYHAQAAATAVAARSGPPVARTNLSFDAELGPLFVGPLRPVERHTEKLSAAERTRAIEEVLRRGRVASMQLLKTGQYHAQDVWVVEFEERLPGEGPIKAAFKPEPTWPGKTECWYAREVMAYAFDQRFAQTGRINPTVETMLPVPSSPTDTVGTWSVGSLSFWEPYAEPYGRRPPDHAEDGLTPPDQIPTHLAHVAKEPWFQRELAEIKTLAWILNNADLLKNQVVPRDNLANLLIVGPPNERSTRVIDWASAAGGDRNSGCHRDPIEDGFLPSEPDPRIVAGLGPNTRQAVEDVIAEFVKSDDAAFVADRAERARKRWTVRR
jgi:hypothetical protein